MKSAMYLCRVYHRRLRPDYQFRHSTLMFLIDLDEPPVLHRLIFGLGAPALFSFCESDHFLFDPRRLPLREKMAELLGEAPERILLLTSVRMAGYVFNPVSFYFCAMRDGRRRILAEVNNTFGEQKPFFVEEGLPSLTKKNFYVSPFIAEDMQFRFKIRKPGSMLRIAISSVSQAGLPILQGVLVGVRETLSNTHALLAFMRFPFATIKVIFFIHWHALRLYIKGVPHYPKDPVGTHQLGRSNHV